MTITEPLSPDVFLQPQTWANPYPVYAQLRDLAPLQIEGFGAPAWLLLTYDQVYGALRDHASFASGRGPNDSGQFPLLSSNPPRHTQLRALVNRAFTPRRVAEARPWIASIIDELLDGLDDVPVDTVAAFTMPLPVQVIARLLGVPGEMYPTFKQWSDASLSLVTLDPTERTRIRAELESYFREQAEDRRMHPGDDLISALGAAEIDGEPLDDADLIGFCRLLLVAGNETTTNLLGNMLNLLADRPDLWARLREDRSLTGPFIDETLRYESPVQFLARRTTRDVVVDGVSIPEGAMVRVVYGAANRDPAAFPDPDTVRLDRELHKNLAFGYGIHYCLGAPLALLEAELTLEALLDRYAGLERGMGPAARQQVTPTKFGFAHLPLRLVPV